MPDVYVRTQRVVTMISGHMLPAGRYNYFDTVLLLNNETKKRVVRKIPSKRGAAGYRKHKALSHTTADG